MSETGQRLPTLAEIEQLQIDLLTVQDRRWWGGHGALQLWESILQRITAAQDARLMALGSPAELRERAEALDHQARWISSDDWAATKGLLGEQFACEKKARQMRERADTLLIEAGMVPTNASAA